MNPLDQSRQTAVWFKRVLVFATVQDPILDICKPVSGRNLIERLGRLQMDAAQGYPADLQLCVPPQLCFRRKIPLPGIGQVVVVLDSLFWAATGYPVKQGHPRRKRSIEVPHASRRNRSGSIVGFHPDQNADGITREELPNAGAQRELASAEYIPGDSETRSNQVIVAGRQRAVCADGTTCPWGTCVLGTAGEKDAVTSSTTKRRHVKIGPETGVVVVG